MIYKTDEIDALLARLSDSAARLVDAAENIDFPAAYLDPAYDYADEANAAAAIIRTLRAERDEARQHTYDFARINRDLVAARKLHAAMVAREKKLRMLARIDEALADKG